MDFFMEPLLPGRGLRECGNTRHHEVNYSPPATVPQPQKPESALFLLAENTF
jgi:hypothetical protein